MQKLTNNKKLALTSSPMARPMFIMRDLHMATTPGHENLGKVPDPLTLTHAHECVLILFVQLVNLLGWIDKGTTQRPFY